MVFFFCKCWAEFVEFDKFHNVDNQIDQKCANVGRTVAKFCRCNEFFFFVVLLWSPGWAAGGGLVRVHEDGAGVAGPGAAAPGHLFLALKPVGPSSAAHSRANGPKFAKFRLFFFFLFFFFFAKIKTKICPKLAEWGQPATRNRRP